MNPDHDPANFEPEALPPGGWECLSCGDRTNTVDDTSCDACGMQRGKKRDLLVMHDAPGRPVGIRPSLQSQLVQITNPNDGGYVAIAIGTDGSMHVVVHKGDVRVDDRRGRG